MIKNLYLLLILALIATSCLKENIEGCPAGKLSISLKYTINVENEDHLDEKIGQINLYIFNDATGLLVRIIPINQEQLLRGVYFTDLDQGIYTFVAWAVNGRDISQGGYDAVDMTDFAKDTHTTPTVGTTNINNFRVRLRTTALGTDRVPANGIFNELYHAKAANIVVREGEQTINFDFTKNTNALKVRVQGLEYLIQSRSTTPEVELFAIGTDDRYNAHNVAGAPATSLRYQRDVSYPETNVAQSDIHVLRLDMELHKSHPMLLHLQEKATTRELIKPIDILALILKIRNEDGTLIFKTQEDLDRWDEFPIVLKIAADLSVTVGIEGFEIKDTEGEL